MGAASCRTELPIMPPVVLACLLRQAGTGRSQGANESPPGRQADGPRYDGGFTLEKNPCPSSCFPLSVHERTGRVLLVVCPDQRPDAGARRWRGVDGADVLSATPTALAGAADRLAAGQGHAQ